MTMKRDKKICSITTIAPTTQTFVLDSMIEMQRRGWDVTLICNMNQNLIDRIPKGMKYYHVPMERSFSISAALKSTLQLIRIFKKENFSIIQYGTTHAALFSSFAGWITRIPCRIHMQWGIYNFWEMGMKGKFFKFVEQLTCALSTTIRPVSKKNLDVAVREHLFKPGKGKVLGEGGTIGVRIEDYPLEKKDDWKKDIRRKNNISQDSFVFGFIGRISRDKGNNELIKAFQQICSDRNMHLILVGPDEKSIEPELSNWAYNSSNVSMVGNVNHDDIPKYLAAMDVLVHPTYREGFGMVLQEAMAMEVGIITTDIPGPSEVIENNISGFLVPPHDSELLSSKMMEVFKSPSISQQLGKNGRIRVENHFMRPKMIHDICNDRESLLNDIINE